MKTNIAPLLLLAVLRYASGCLGPVPMDMPVACEQTAITRILTNTDSDPNTLDVIDGVDSFGEPFQLATLQFGSTEYTDPGSLIVFVVNDQQQNTTIWNGRRVGIGRPVQVPDGNLVHNFCTNAASFWMAPVGFGTTGENRLGSRDPGYSSVGHPLVNGQRIELRLDVCSGNSCTPGIPRTFTVRLVR